MTILEIAFTDVHWDTLEAIASGDRTIRIDGPALAVLLERGYVEMAEDGPIATPLGRARFAARFVT